MNAWYPLALSAALQGDLDLNDAVILVALDDTYTYSAAHNFRDDLIGELGETAPLASKTFTAGVFNAAPTLIAGIGAPDVIVAYALVIDTGVDATSQLVVFFDRAADSTLIQVEGNGADVTITFPTGAIASI